MKALFCLLSCWPLVVAGQSLPADTTAPSLYRLYAPDAHTLILQFSKPVTASGRMNYFVGPRPGVPDSLHYDAAAPDRVALFFNHPFPENRSLLLTAYNVRDARGNRLEEAKAAFTWHPPQRFDIVIDEILADPTPSQGLPGGEFLEIRNTCRYPLDLLNWQLSDTTRSVLLPGFFLQPDSFLILCDSRAAALYRPYGRTIGLAGFPSLNNNGDLLTLRDREGAVIHAVAYGKAWYGTRGKEEGGWSLEMKDVRHPCSGGFNWSPAIAAGGGTPGKINSIDANISGPVPDLLQVTVKDPFTLIALFNQTLDSAEAAGPGHYHIPEGIVVRQAEVMPPLFRSVVLHLDAPLRKGKVYTLEVRSLGGCSGAVTGVRNQASFGITETAGPGDLLLSEILFHPRPGGTEFVEIYNPSSGITDLHDLFIARRGNDGGIGKAYRLSAVSRPFFPDSYLVITADPDNIRRTYYCKDPAAFVMPEKMPVWPDEHGDVLLLNEGGEVLDEFVYDEKDHYGLITDAAGVSLERVRFDLPAQAAGNWASAAADAGYATPTYRNTQAFTGNTAALQFTVTPDVVSPDGDGFDDEALLAYRLTPGTWMANISVFDAKGRPVRQLYRSSLLSGSGMLRWDGKDDHYTPVRTGIYIIYVEAFRSDGTVRKWKLRVSIVRPI